MNITITENEAEALIYLKRMLKQAATPTPEFLHWIAERLVQVHEDDPNADFVQKVREYSRDFYKIQGLLSINR